MANPTLPICRQYTLGAVLRHSQSPSKWTPNSQRRGSKAIELGVLANLLGPWSSTGSGPLYRRLANALRGSITRGDLPAGTQLPAERLLATALNVSRTTVVAAYETLRVEDAIERRQGSGSYVRPRPQLWQWSLDEFASSVPTARGEEEISDKATHIRFTSAAPAFTDIQSPEIAEAFAVDLSQHWTGHGYTVLGLEPLREAVARHLTALGVKTHAEQVLITSGAQQAICLIGALFIAPGDALLIEDPTWIGAIDAFKASRARLVSVDVDHQGLRVDQCLDLFRTHSPKLVYCSPSFHNPTGCEMVSRRRRDLVSLASEVGLPVVEDLTLADLAVNGRCLPPLASLQSDSMVLTIGSMSKLFWGGLRIGWIRADEQTVSRLAHIKLAFDHGSSPVSQAIAIKLFEHIDSARDIRRQQIQERLGLLTELMNEILPDWTWKHPDGGFSLWAKLPLGNAVEFAQVAMRQGVEVVPGSIASPSRRHSDCLRVPYVLQPSVIRDGVHRLGDAWKAYSSALDRRALRELLV